MAKKKKKQKANNIEELMRDYARSILGHLAEAGMIDRDSFGVIKAASDEFLKGAVPELLNADVGAIIRLVRPARARGGAVRLHNNNGEHPPKTGGNGTGSPSPPPVERQPDPFQGGGLWGDDYYEGGIDF